MTDMRDGAGARLEVRHLVKTYTSRNRSIAAIGDLTFTVEPGEFVCIIGPSGAGKTTLLRCVGGLLAATSGEILLNGSAVTAPPRDMAVVFQQYERSLFPWLTVTKNVELPLGEKGLDRKARREAAAEALAAVGLSDFAHVHPWQLSGGMQQRVAIARALAMEPRVMLMDEPFAAVDAQTRAELEDLVRRLWLRLGVTVLFVTHDIDESVYLADRVIVLSGAPTTVVESVTVQLPRQRSQLETRSSPEFARCRSHVLGLVQRATAAARQRQHEIEADL